ncbi:MAG: hypothetical protein M0Q92_08070 [Methanoregula sp.]|jgi:hypothetical protein|nr:hypothetical protein [Methanoregula sp.]
MRIIEKPVIILAAWLCAAVIFAPFALAAEQGAGNMQVQPAGGMMRNQSGLAPPMGGNGPGGMGDGNMTRFGNSTMTPPGLRDFGNMTASDSTMMQHGPGGIGDGNMTAPPDAPGYGQGTEGGMARSGGQSTGKSQQQSQDDTIASLISQLQALLVNKE